MVSRAEQGRRAHGIYIAKRHALHATHAPRIRELARLAHTAPSAETTARADAAAAEYGLEPPRYETELGALLHPSALALVDRLIVLLSEEES